jgi:hypothetical protein
VNEALARAIYLVSPPHTHPKTASECSPAVHNAHISEEPPPNGPLSDAELDSFIDLLRRFCEYELDRRQSWLYPTSYDNVYINISRRLPEGHPEAAYDGIPRR